MKRITQEEFNALPIVDKYGKDSICHDVIKLLKRIADKESA